MSKALTYFRTENDPRGPQICKEMNTDNIASGAARQIRDAIIEMTKDDPDLLSFTVKVTVECEGQFRDMPFAATTAKGE